MDIGMTSSMEQTQMRRMDGSGGGNGQGGGMTDILSDMSSEDQATVKNQMSSYTMEEKMAKMAEMKQVYKASMSAQDYTQTILDIFDEDATNEAETDGFSVYA